VCVAEDVRRERRAAIPGARPQRRAGPDDKNLGGAGNYVILDAEGRGHYIGCNLSVHNLYKGWWGEGDDMIFVDGEVWPPTLHGTGSEEYFGQGWGMQDVQFPYFGLSYECEVVLLCCVRPATAVIPRAREHDGEPDSAGVGRRGISLPHGMPPPAVSPRDSSSDGGSCRAAILARNDPALYGRWWVAGSSWIRIIPRFGGLQRPGEDHRLPIPRRRSDPVHEVDPGDDRTRPRERPVGRLLLGGVLVPGRAAQAVSAASRHDRQASEPVERKLTTEARRHGE